MRKFFSLFAALLVVLAVNATTKTNIIAGTNTLHTALNQANAGDTIVLADGTYVENKDGANNYISFRKDVVVMAAEGAKPVIDMYVAMSIKSGALVEIKGLKFDATHVMESNISWANHMLYAEDNANNRVIFDGCEFYNDTVDAASISCGSSEKIDSLVIKNCYFHDIRKCVLSLNNADAKVSIINTTFNNISNTGSSWYAPINMEAATGKLRVDNCTFYDVLYMGNVYGSIYAPNFTDAIVSNSVFQLSTSEDCYIVYFHEGAQVKNCVTYNYDNWAPFCRGNYATITACTKGDPKFADAANGKFTLTAGSRALDYVGKAADNTTDSVMNLGDPRWVPQPKTLYCEMTQGWWTADGAAVGCYAWNGSDANKVENAAWPGVRMTSLGEGVWSYDVSAKYDNVIFTRVNPTGDIADWGFKSYDLALPAQWDYYTLTTSSKSEAEAAGNKSAGTWTKLNPTLENGWYLIGTFGGEDAWTFETLTAEKKFAVNPENAEEFIVTAALAAGDEFKAAYVYYDQINDIKPAGTGNNYVVDADHAGATKSIYFRQDYYGSWGGHFYVPENAPAPLDNIDVEAIVNNQSGTLLTEGEQVQGTTVNFGVNASNERVAADAGDAIMIVSGKYHSEHGLTNAVFTIAVPGNVDIYVGECTYSGKTITVTNSASAVVASKTPETVCWKNDHNNVAVLHYVGEATTLTITGMDYCPYIRVKTASEEPVITGDIDVQAIVNNGSGTLLTAGEMEVQYTAVNFGVNASNARVAADAEEAILIVSGQYHSEHGLYNPVFTVKVPGDVDIYVGQCTYSTSAITVKNSENETVASEASPTAACWKNSTSNVTTLHYEGGATTLTISGMQYCPFVRVKSVSSSTAIDNTVVGEKTVKFFREGQLYIEKDGKIYNVLGVEIK